MRAGVEMESESPAASPNARPGTVRAARRARALRGPERFLDARGACGRACCRVGATPAAAADGFDAMATLSARGAVEKNTRRDVTEARRDGGEECDNGGDVWNTTDTCLPHACVGRRGVAARVVGRSRASKRGPLRRRAVHGIAKHGVFAARASGVTRDGGTNLAGGAEVLRQGDHELLGGHILHGAGRGRHGACAAKKGAISERSKTLKSLARVLLGSRREPTGRQISWYRS